MRNTVLITSLGLAIIAGGAIAAGGELGGKHHRPDHNFEELDANGDGRLMPEEMDAHMQARFEGADADGNGSLSKEELLARVNERMVKRAETYVSHMIDRHDTDGDGALTMNEMRADRHARMFARMDADNDGAVSKEEFEDMREMRRGKRHKRHWMKDNSGSGE